MKKRVLALLMTAVLFAFVGCGNEAATVQETESATTEQTVEEETEVVEETTEPE